jgi:flavodoxin
MKSLVVYYSRTGKTKFVAETIAAELGSEIEEIVDLKKS